MHNTKDRKLNETIKLLEQGVTEVFQTEKYKQYLSVCGRLHEYSVNNLLLIVKQRPDATQVAGYAAWNSLHRQVNKGEKGINIIAPVRIRRKETDSDTDCDKEKEQLYFKVVKVYDISQTSGEELPEPVPSRIGDSSQYDRLFDVLTEISPVPVKLASRMKKGTYGSYNRVKKEIKVRASASGRQKCKTCVHEIANALFDTAADGGDKETQDVRARSVSYVVCQHLGIDTSDYSFAHIAEWGRGKAAKELKAELQTMKETASQLIGQIDKRLYEIDIA